MVVDMTDHNQIEVQMPNEGIQFDPATLTSANADQEMDLPQEKEGDVQNEWHHQWN